MNLYDDYAAFTEMTAIYPQQVAAEYLTLGLCSEAAECVELLLTKRNTNLVQLGNTLGAEVSDVQWYTARLAMLYNFTFSEIVEDAKRAYRPTAHDIDSLLSRITVEAGLIAGKVKKQLRDGHTWNGEQREEARQYILARLIGVVLLTMYVTDWLYANHSAEYSSYDKVLKMNRRKLEDRAARGVLRGSGDTR